MAPLLLTVAGVVVLGAALLILRSFGPGYRIGRLLAVAPLVTVAEARQIAEAGEQRYVRVEGRIDSDAEFEDADHRPLVLRRTTLAWRPAGSAGGWTSIDTRVEAVPFLVREGLDEIGVDVAALGPGLVVVPRESVGQARDIEELTAAGVAPDAEARLLVEHVSTVEHATVVGVPARAPDGSIAMGPGLQRPLVLSTLERDEAMRVLAGGATDRAGRSAERARLAFACLVLGAVLIGAAALWWLVDAAVGGVATAFAASPDPTLRPGTDTRTPGGAPSFIGNPGLALLGVIGVAVASLAASLAYVRLTGGRRQPKVLPRDPRDRR